MDCSVENDQQLVTSESHGVGDDNKSGSLEHPEKKLQWKLDVEVVYYARDAEGRCALC
jgi:hypothetical protein